MKNMKGQFNLLLSFLLLFVVNVAVAQVSDSKTIKKEYSGKKAVALVHSQGPILVQNSPDNKVYITAKITVTAKDQESLDAVFEHFKIKESGAGEKIDLRTSFDVESWNSNNNNTTIVFKDGKKVKGIKELKTSVTLLVPDLRDLRLENKYGDIQLESKSATNTAVQLFSGELSATRDINALDLSFKYSKAYLKNIGASKMVLFDSDIVTGNVDRLEISSKYSGIKMGDVAGDLNITAFDDKWKVGNVNGDLEILDKYSEFEFGTFKAAKATLFDANFEARSGFKLYLENSKYSEYKIDEIKNLEFKLSFDDNVEIDKTGSLICSDSKYSSYDIDELTDILSLSKSFDDDVKIEKVGAKFEYINLDGKYTKMNLQIDEGAEFEVSVDMQYGKFDHPQFDIRTQKEVGNRKEMTGYVGPEKVQTSRLTVRGFDNTVYWR